MLKQEILDNISELKEELNKANDGVQATKEVAQKVIASVQAKFSEYQQTQSIMLIKFEQ